MLVKGVVRGRLGEACRYVIITTFSIGAVIVYLPTLTPIGIVNGFQGRFYGLERALIRLSSKSNDK